MGEGFDDRYVGFREHAAAQQRTDAELSRLRERQATIEATLLHEVAAMRADVGELKQLLLTRPSPPDHATLATHRALDALQQTVERFGAGGAGRSGNAVLMGFALVGAVALGAFVWQLAG
jgi:hypothetical protein